MKKSWILIAFVLCHSVSFASTDTICLGENLSTKALFDAVNNKAQDIAEKLVATSTTAPKPLC